MKIKYSFGVCQNCGRTRSLKNGICRSCENKVERKTENGMPDFMKEVFGGFDKK